MEISKESRKYFTKHLSAWHANENDRDLPWKGEKDPYRIWLSEVILQQTRALQGLPYYLNFTTTYPTVQDMAAANDDDVFRIWQGLGYYNRCKNMLGTARIIAREMNGRFPDTYEGLLELKGIGPYTAAAIASFAFGRPNAVVDGNVYRVLSRYFGIDTPFDTTAGKKQFATLAQELLDSKNSAAYNQAIMDLGATVCTPSAPKCDNCPLIRQCFASAQGLTAALPVKSKKIVVKERWFNYFFLQYEDTVWIEKRGSGDIWENLHQPFLILSDGAAEPETLANELNNKGIAFTFNDIIYKGNSKQRLTHQQINARFYTIDLKTKPVIQSENGIWLSINELKKLAFPKTLVSFLKNNYLLLR